VNYHELPMEKITERESDKYSNSNMSSAEKRYPHSHRVSPQIFAPIDEEQEPVERNSPKFNIVEQSAEKPLNQTPSKSSIHKTSFVVSDTES
jgi:hypothetical protein